MAAADCGAHTAGQNKEMPMGKKRHLIAIVDDDTSVRESTLALVQSMGFAVKSFPCAEDFLMSEDIRDTSCLIADMRMSGMSGLELHAHLAGSGRAIPTIVITAYPNERDRLRARQFGI